MMMPSPQPLHRQSNYRWLNFTRTYSDSLLLSIGFCTLVTLLFLASSDEFLHWFVLPVWACGVIVGTDAADWMRGRISLFDPVGIIGVIGLHFFFLSPLMHVGWEYFMDAPTLPFDWRAALGGMAIFNFVGLLIYRYFRDVFLRYPPPPVQTVWRLNRPRFVLFTGIMLFVTALLQAWVYSRYGGISGYMQAATDLENPNQMQGMGLIFLVSETFPVLAIMLFAVLAQSRPSWQSWTVLALVLLSFLVLRILFGGLRGSRSTILFALLWASGILHFYVRPIPRQFVMIGIAFMVMFMYAYGFYKAAGAAGIQAVGDSTARAELAQSSGRDLQSVLLGDLSRSDVQAYIFDQLWSPVSNTHSDYQYAWGRTYLGAVALFVPRSLWPGRPAHKVLEGTEIVYGRGSYEEGETWSSKIYGLAGETMLNFGPMAIPIAFMLFGLVVSLARRFLLSLQVGDTRLLLFPFVAILCVVLLTADSDNIMFNIVQNGTVPFLVTFVGSIIVQRQIVVQRVDEEAVAA